MDVSNLATGRGGGLGAVSADPRVIRVVGARQHNLKNVTVTIPRNALTVITGLSGSGKSSLAFDTIYAEGERRYVESLSTYVRQFLEQMPRPDVDSIEGLSPTVSIEQRAATANPRSTVATLTEVYDYLRLLFAHVGRPHCPRCRRPITQHTTAQMVDAVLARPAGTRVMILAPLPAAAVQRGDLLDSIAKQGFIRLRVDGVVHALESVPPWTAPGPKRLDVVVDRLTVRPEIAVRLADSFELAQRLADGHAVAAIAGADGEFHDHPYSSAYACPEHPQDGLPELSPRIFSFNSPYGACPTCDGLGTVLEFDPDLIVPNNDLSLAGGALAPWRVPSKRAASGHAAFLASFCERFGVSTDIPFRNLPQEQIRILLYGTPDAESSQRAFEGVIPALRKRWAATASESVKQKLHQYLSEAPCQACHGARLRPGPLAVTLGGKNIAEVCDLSVAEALRFFDALTFEAESAAIAEQPLREIRSRLRFMHDVGVEYLSLSRGSATLSGGETQRIRLATQIGSGLIGMCYVLDEPTIGLHQGDSARLIATLQRLARAGNAVIVVEHDEDVIRAADYLIDIGPGAGADGGKLLFEGSLDELLECKASITADYLGGRRAIPVPQQRRPLVRTNAMEIRGARAHNLKNLTVRFPLGCFLCVTGVSGSGKSTLVTHTLQRLLHRRIHGHGPRPGAHDRIIGANRVDKIIQIDQSPIGRSPRSNSATYVGAFDHIRQVFAKTREAKIRGYAPNRFSFNVKGGRCEECQGQGTKRIEMHFLPDVFVQCGTCRGTRYNRETLEVRYRGKSIADVLDLRVEEAAVFFQNFPKIRHLLRALLDVGVGYIVLGQSSTTLSGGEAQRIKLAAELGRPTTGHTLYILDEPTTGLHFADIDHLLIVLNRLVTLGHSVIVIEHNLDVIKQADWVIDLGPDGGDAGGQVVAEGPPETIAASPSSHTGRFLKDRLAAPSAPPPAEPPPSGTSPPDRPI